MFYKKDSNGDWWTGSKIYFADGTVFKAKTTKTKDGWQWHDEPPQEYIDYLEINNSKK